MTRQQIIDEISSLLSRITIVNGFHSDLGEVLSYWQDYPNQYGTNILVYQDTEESASEQGEDWVNTLQVEIEGRVSDSIEPVKILEDIYSAIGHDPTLGGKCIKILPPSNQVLVETEGRVVSRAIVILGILYRTPRW